MRVCSTYTCMYVHMCYEYIPLALFLCKALTHAQTHTHTHTQSIHYKELAHAIQEAKSHHPQGKPGKLMVSLLNSSLSPTTPEPGAATESASAQGQEKKRPSPQLAETASPSSPAFCPGHLLQLAWGHLHREGHRLGSALVQRLI